MDNEQAAELKQAVFEIVGMIPPGRATSYGAIARAAGFPLHSRMVGKIMSGSAFEGLPAHRVVNSQGILSAREAFGAPGRMRELLESEGVRVNGGRISEWKKIFWDPLLEIGGEGCP